MKTINMIVFGIYLFCTVVCFICMQKYIVPFHVEAERKYRNMPTGEVIGCRLIATFMSLVPVMNLLYTMMFALVPLDKIRADGEKMTEDYYKQNPEEEEKLNK